MKLLIILNQNFPILSVFITLLLRSFEGQLQPGEMKADSLPQIFHTLVLHHTRWALTREALLSSHTNDFVAGPFPNLCWPNKEQTAMQKNCTEKHNKDHAFDNVLAICFEGFWSQKFSYLLLCGFTTIFHLAIIVKATLSEMLCFLSTEV